MSYTIQHLRELLRTAKQLGFADDVAHWEKELERAEEERS